MTTHTTFETSRLLAENGFPQPTPEFGQIWQHEEHGNMTFIYANPVTAGIAEPQMFYSFCPENGRPRGFFVDEIPKYLVFAPTLSDIFNWMKSICQEKKDPRIYREWKGIFMNALESDPENTAEAVALAAILFIADK